DVAGEGGAEKAGQAEIVAASAALVVERSLVGGNQPAALFDERLQLGALRIGEVGDIRQGQDSELLHVRRVELAVPNYLEGDTGFHQRVIEPGRVVLRGPRCRRGDQPDARQRALVAQILLILPVPDVKVLDGLEPAAVERLGIELDHPGAKALSDAIHGPQPDLVGVLGGILPAVSLLESDAEYTHDRLRAGGRAGLLRIPAVLPGQLELGAALPVRKQNRDRNAVAYLVESIGEKHGPRVALPDLAIPEGVQIQEAFLLPCGELSARVAGLPGCR